MSTKPWIISSIFKSIIVKTKHTMYYITHFLSNNVDKVA